MMAAINASVRAGLSILATVALQAKLFRPAMDYNTPESGASNADVNVLQRDEKRDENRPGLRRC